MAPNYRRYMFSQMTLRKNKCQSRVWIMKFFGVIQTIDCLHGSEDRAQKVWVCRESSELFKNPFCFCLSTNFNLLLFLFCSFWFHFTIILKESKTSKLINNYRWTIGQKIVSNYKKWVWSLLIYSAFYSMAVVVACF